MLAEMSTLRSGWTLPLARTVETISFRAT